MTIPEFIAGGIGAGFIVRLLLGAYAGLLNLFEQVLDAMFGPPRGRG